MKFFKKKEPEPKLENPRLTFELIDGIHLEVVMEWPEGCDIEPFAHVLMLLNTGKLTGAQLAAAAIYASRIGQPEKAMTIHSALEQVASSPKKEKNSSDRPVIPPSKFMSSQMKSHSI